MADYQLHQLGWHSFQQLCLTVCEEIFGQTVQSFLDSNDGGRDGAFAGKWVRRRGESLKGKFVIQCKFTSKPTQALRPSDVSDELEKARRLVQARRCDSYILITNYEISGITAEALEDAFAASGVKHFLSYGAGWICRQITECKRLRMLVPRVYGLGDLGQILDERAYEQATAVLESMREDLSKVVVTKAYKRAVRALEEHSFVLLLGEPACGKTTIAAMLAMAAIDQWRVSTMKLESAGEMTERWNPSEPRQFFWVDDAFGVMQYEAQLALEWNRKFSKIRAMLTSGARVVLTSRDYVYRSARVDLKESAFPLLRESQVVINVQDITHEERRQILYNHIKLGTQPRGFRTALKPFLENIVSHSRFTPEMARRLGGRFFTKDLSLSKSGLFSFVEKQEEFLQEVIQGLDTHSKAALALVFLRNGALESPIRLRPSEETSLVRLGSTLGKVVAAIGALRGTLIVNVKEGGKALWKFKHPTIGDALAANLLKNPELMDIYVEGAPSEDLIQTITCGDVRLRGAVVVPQTLFPSVMNKIGSFLAGTSGDYALDRWEREGLVDSFLTRRCNRAFLKVYLQRNLGILPRVSMPGRYLSVVSEVGLVKRLFQLRLLPERYRREFVETVARYAISGEDGHVFADTDMRRMFTLKERRSFLRRTRQELVPKLPDIRHRWQANYPGDLDPQSYLQPYLDVLSGLETEFSRDKEVKRATSKERAFAENWAEERLHEFWERNPEYPVDEPEFEEGKRVAAEEAGVRSIFEDVDL